MKNKEFRTKVFRGAKIEDAIMHLNKKISNEQNQIKKETYKELLNYLTIKFDYEA